MAESRHAPASDRLRHEPRRRRRDEAERLGFDDRARSTSTCPSRRRSTPSEIVEAKARAAYGAIGRPVLVEDSGLAIRAWGGFPGRARQVAREERGRPRDPGDARRVRGPRARRRSARSPTATAARSSRRAARHPARSPARRAARADSDGTRSSSRRAATARSPRWPRRRRTASPTGGAPGTRWRRGSRCRGAPEARCGAPPRPSRRPRWRRRPAPVPRFRRRRRPATCRRSRGRRCASRRSSRASKCRGRWRSRRRAAARDRAARAASASSCAASSTPKPIYVVPDVEAKGESGLMGLALAPDYRVVAAGSTSRTRTTRRTGHGRPHRAAARRRRRVLAADRPHRGHPGRAVPRRLPPAVRPRRQALRHDRRRDESRDRAGPEVARRQDAAPERGRLDSRRQSLSRLAGVLATGTAIPRASTGIRSPGSSSRPSTVPRASTGRAAATRSTSSRPGRTTAGRWSTTAPPARGWSRRCSSTRRRWRRREPRSAAGTCCRTSRATSSSRRSSASG